MKKQIIIAAIVSIAMLAFQYVPNLTKSNLF